MALLIDCGGDVMGTERGEDQSRDGMTISGGL